MIVVDCYKLGSVAKLMHDFVASYDATDELKAVLAQRQRSSMHGLANASSLLRMLRFAGLPMFLWESGDVDICIYIYNIIYIHIYIERERCTYLLLLSHFGSRASGFCNLHHSVPMESASSRVQSCVQELASEANSLIQMLPGHGS